MSENPLLISYLMVSKCEELSESHIICTKSTCVYNKLPHIFHTLKYDNSSHIHCTKIFCAVVMALHLIFFQNLFTFNGCISTICRRHTRSQKHIKISLALYPPHSFARTILSLEWNRTNLSVYGSTALYWTSATFSVS